MYFCFTAPVDYEYIHRKRKRHFALAQWCRNHPGYLELMRELRGRGDHIILDNGAYEGEMLDFPDLYEIAWVLKPNVLVLPDFIGQPKETEYVSRQFQKSFVATVETMFVLHSTETLEEYIWRYAAIKTSWIGIPKKLRVEGKSRLEMFKFLKDAKLIRKNISHHLLGLNSNELEELAFFRDICVSCDNSLYKDVPNNLQYTMSEWEKICQASH